jgi:hypothetical protein
LPRYDIDSRNWKIGDVVLAPVCTELACVEPELEKEDEEAEDEELALLAKLELLSSLLVL